MSDHLKNLLLALYLALALGACGKPDANNLQALEADSTVTVAEVSNAEIEQAFKARKSDVQVSGHGVVIKLLKDDNKGSRHQKFLVKINAQQTLLFAHNIDLAPRVPVQTGDEISFYGEYVYNPKGGVIHWTHHAPQGDHVAGWVMHNGQKYQ
ncbi:MAG TPA: DUF3465 domain-containing protein [Methylotenera sp.]|jgi:hypothetical protein